MTPEGGVLWGQVLDKSLFLGKGTCLRGKLGPGQLLSLQAALEFSSAWLVRALPWGCW